MRSSFTVVPIVVTALFGLFVLATLFSLYIHVPMQVLWGQVTSAFVVTALKLTLLTSLMVTALAFLLGTPVAYALARVQFRGKVLVDTLLELPMVLPPVAVGLALLFFLGRKGLIGPALERAGIEVPFTTAAVVIVQFFLAAPFYIRSAKNGLEMVDPALERASLSLGASPLSTFVRVTLPLARNSVLAGLALTWARSIGEFGGTIMFAGNYIETTQTASLAIFTAMQGNINAAIALSVVVLTACFVLFVGMRTLTRGRLLYA